MGRRKYPITYLRETNGHYTHVFEGDNLITTPSSSNLSGVHTSSSNLSDVECTLLLLILHIT